MMQTVFIGLLLIGASYCYPGSSRVVNGTDAAIGQYPFVVSLRVYTGAHNCGASIIRDQWILTAAHCVYGYTPSLLNIQYGVTTIDAAGPNIAAVKNIIMHEKYSSQELINDIALIQLEGRLSINGKTIKIIPLPEQGFEVPANARGTLVGWGYEKTGGTVQKYLQQVELKIYSDQECSDRYEGKTTVDHICGGVDEGGKGQCSGDSGGPLVYDGVQVGIVSWSMKPCTIAPYPGVYTKVSHYVDWINSKIN